jgi:hypothetical protein
MLTMAPSPAAFPEQADHHCPHVLQRYLYHGNGRGCCSLKVGILVITSVEGLAWHRHTFARILFLIASHFWR